MKDFALYLNCSVEDVEKVVVLIEGTGVSRYYRGRRQSDNYMYVSVRNSNDRFYVYNEGNPVNRDNPLYQMPQDWDKIQAALGIKVTPEYVEIIDNKNKYKTWEKYHIGSVCRVVGEHPTCGVNGITINKPKGGAGYLFNGDFKPSTRESYEAQEAKKQDPIITETSKLRAILLKKSKRIAGLEKENEGLQERNSYQANRLCEVEDNNEKLFEMALEARNKNKALLELNANQVEQIKSLDADITEYKRILDNIASNFA